MTKTPIAVLGIDLGKNSCSLEGLDATGAVVLRRRMTREGVVRFVAALAEPGASVSIVARRYDVNANQLFKWRREFGGSPSCDHCRSGAKLLPVEITPALGAGGSPRRRSVALQGPVGSIEIALPNSPYFTILNAQQHRCPRSIWQSSRHRQEKRCLTSPKLPIIWR